MNAQFYAAPGRPVTRAFGQPLETPHGAGVLRVLEGSVWLTRVGDPLDHVLAAGQQMRLEAGDQGLLEPIDAERGARWCWEPVDAQPGRLRRAATAGAGGLAVVRGAGRRLAAALLRGVAAASRALAAGLRRVEDVLDDLARKAASTARRAQGCMAAGESMASSGGVQ